MRIIQNDCIACARGSYHCMGNSCPNRSVEHFYCDSCGCEEELYYFDGQELCLDCIAERLQKVEGSEVNA